MKLTADVILLFRLAILRPSIFTHDRVFKLIYTDIRNISNKIYQFT